MHNFKEQWNKVKGLTYVGLYFKDTPNIYGKVIAQNGNEVYVVLASNEKRYKGLAGFPLSIECNDTELTLENYEPVSSEEANETFLAAKKEIEFILANV